MVNSEIDSSDEDNLDENILDEFKTVIEGFEPAIEEIGERIQRIQNALENYETNWFTQEVQPISPGLIQFWKFYTVKYQSIDPPLNRGVNTSNDTWPSELVQNSDPLGGQSLVLSGNLSSLEFKTLLSKLLGIAKTDLAKRTITFQEEDMKFFEGFKNGGTIFDFIPYLVRNIKFLG